MEMWRDIRGYEGLYQVSNYGRVRSLDRVIEYYQPTAKKLVKTLFKGKILKSNFNYGSGHYQVLLCNNGEEKWHQVHVLVAEAFLPNPSNCDIVHHKDHDTSNNRVENLEWLTKEEHDLGHGTEKSKVVYQYTLDGDLVAIWASANEAARQLGYSQGNITMCCQGKRKSHKGYIWSYIPL